MQNDNKLYELRTSRHMTQKEFAEKVGMNAGVYARYERGENDIPLSVAMKIAKAFDISIDYIAGYSKSELGLSADKDNMVIEDTIVNPLLLNSQDPQEGAKELARRLENQLNAAVKALEDFKQQYVDVENKKSPSE